jgi:transketolase
MSPITEVSQAAIDQLCINTMRTLSMDAVQQANSGRPGTPSAPLKELQKKFGFTPEAVVAAAKQQIARRG